MEFTGDGKAAWATGEKTVWRPTRNWNGYMPVSILAISWWRHQVETFSTLLALCAGNSPVSGEFHTQRPVTRSFDGFFFICAWVNGWVNNREAGDLRRYRAHYDVTVTIQIIDTSVFCMVYTNPRVNEVNLRGVLNIGRYNDKQQSEDHVHYFFDVPHFHYIDNRHKSVWHIHVIYKAPLDNFPNPECLFTVTDDYGTTEPRIMIGNYGIGYSAGPRLSRDIRSNDMNSLCAISMNQTGINIKPYLHPSKRFSKSMVTVEISNGASSCS